MKAVDGCVQRVARVIFFTIFLVVTWLIHINNIITTIFLLPIIINKQINLYFFIIYIDKQDYNKFEQQDLMGCTAMSGEEPDLRIIQVKVSTQNSYVDQYPRVTIQKLKQKFMTYANERNQLTQDQFYILYAEYFNRKSTIQEQSPTSENQHNKQPHRLFLFFTDLQSPVLKFKQFITKYAIINKCDHQTLSEIIYFLYSPSLNLEEPMKQQNYHQFIKSQRKSFGFQPSILNQKVITRGEFHSKLKQSGFLWEQYRKRFSLIEREDMPFETITRQLIDCQILDYEIGQQYYVLSNSWYERWSYYYQGKDHNLEQEDLKSTKLTRKKNSVQGDSELTLKRKNKKYSIGKSIYDDPQNILLVQKPQQIEFDEIQGQYEGQLKQNLKVNYECRFITLNVWNMLKKVHPTKYEYKRIANSSSTFQLYPKTLYFLKTNEKGQIQDKTLKILQKPLKTKLFKLGNNQEETTYFLKEFGQRSWHQVRKEKMLAQCSADPRFFIVQTTNKGGFLENNTRKETTPENITYGDKVYSYFPFAKKVCGAYVIRFPTQKNVKIHYIKYSFKYEVEVDKETLSVQEESYMTDSIKITLQTETQLFKGLDNIGNTCFMNTIVQSLIATPILDQYLFKNEFSSNKQPLLYALSEAAKKLLMNQKVSPVELKKAIDVHLQVFSGYDQHDAQQFLNLLLDKINDEIKEKPSIIDVLFGGEAKSMLRCCSCKQKREISQKISTLSLPIPESQFNTFVVYVFPVYDSRIRKIIMRLHRFATLKQYLNTFQDRVNKNFDNFIFCEVYGGTIKKIRNFSQEIDREKTITDKGISTNLQIYAFQKIKKSFYLQIEDENRRTHSSSMYVDYLDPKQNIWYFGKLIKKKTHLEKYLPQKGFSTIKLKDEELDDLKPLGQMIRKLNFKKFFLRKYNMGLKRMEFFGYQLMISLPRYVSYAQLQSALEIYLYNYTNTQMENHRNKKNKPYYIRVVDSIKYNCLFCGMGDIKIQNQSQLQRCCHVLEKDIPLIWVARQKQYQIYVDWLDMKKYNAEIMSSIEMDPLSQVAQKQQANDKLILNECFDMILKPETVQMECTKCRNSEQYRTQKLTNVPNILVLHMKQFRVTKQKMLIKLDVNLRWIQYLDISKYCQNQKGYLYELYAYVRHVGSNESGHYTCVTKRKHPFENKKVWVNFDDERTQILPKEEKNIDSAYLLFFKKVDMPISTEINFLGMNK